MLQWYFSPEVYKPYLEDRAMSSTIKGINPENIFTETSKQYPTQPVILIAGNEDYKKLNNETHMDESAIGGQMLSGKDFRPMLEDLNKKWTAARTKYGMK